MRLEALCQQAPGASGSLVARYSTTNIDLEHNVAHFGFRQAPERLQAELPVSLEVP